MTKRLLLCYRRMVHLNMKRKIICKFTILQKYLNSFWNKVLACWLGKSINYRQLSHNQSFPTTTTTATGMPSPPAGVEMASHGGFSENMAATCCCDHSKDSSENVVALKISLLGDNQIGKTSFLRKYVGKEKVDEGLSTKGVNQMDKTLCVKGTRISYSMWEVKGDVSGPTQIPMACKDSVAMFFMFDLTSRCTLSSVLSWHQQARQWNQTAIPVMIGTKFDDFVKLPLDLQWTIASQVNKQLKLHRIGRVEFDVVTPTQARTYAKALNAPLFFSSATYNINVNKIFKFITAKLFNLPWSLERNLTIGEPIIDF